jgi:hypothetical protein
VKIKGRLAALAIVFWLGGLGLGVKTLWAYKTAPGVAGSPPAAWPAESRIRPANVPTLVMLVHPKCPCTRASLTELSVLMEKLGGRLSAYVLFLRPDGVPAGWERTDTWQTASNIPGVSLVRDDGGVEAARFGAVTSGQTMLYDPSGRLLFSGGITGVRGHPGDNAGSRRILSLVESGAADRDRSLVFGCSLLNDDDAPLLERLPGIL